MKNNFFYIGSGENRILKNNFKKPNKWKNNFFFYCGNTIIYLQI